MNGEPKPIIPVWYWIVAVVALLWNLIGCLFFSIELFAQEAFIESMTDEQKAWVRSIPTWIYFAYGVAILSGVAGSVGLLMRKRWSFVVLIVCLAAVLIQMIYTMLIAGGLQAMGPTGLIMPMIVIAIAAALVWFSAHAKKRNWLT